MPKFTKLIMIMDILIDFDWKQAYFYLKATGVL